MSTVVQTVSPCIAQFVVSGLAVALESKGIVDRGWASHVGGTVLSDVLVFRTLSGILFDVATLATLGEMDVKLAVHRHTICMVGYQKPIITSRCSCVSCLLSSVHPMCTWILGG